MELRDYQKEIAYTGHKILDYYNILYLAVGFLEWRDNTKPKQVNHAPLVLIPVAMERKKVGKSFNLEWTGEDIQTNISIKLHK